MWDVLIGVAGALVGLWACLAVLLLWIGRRYERPRFAELLRLLPDVLRLVKRVATDRAVPGAARLMLWLQLAYLLSPVDLIPDIVPVIGYADDAIIAIIALRLVARRAGAEPITRHWPGTDIGLAIVRRAAGW